MFILSKIPLRSYVHLFIQISNLFSINSFLITSYSNNLLIFYT
nr:MAG TPA: hypothetical protein [Bacteriophage sp.]DAY32676.1 MAG TPA: hypothetical protein [Caudoviricetes sp.]DAY37565.1 MAG TPA: hypothetical protein [Caudoviricetes sp.]